jgi:hypothetical protein
VPVARVDLERVLRQRANPKVSEFFLSFFLFLKKNRLRSQSDRRSTVGCRADRGKRTKSTNQNGVDLGVVVAMAAAEDLAAAGRHDPAPTPVMLAASVPGRNRADKVILLHLLQQKCSLDGSMESS